MLPEILELYNSSFLFAYFQDSEDVTVLVDRWFDGLINKDVNISKEIYSLTEFDFDRQVSSAAHARIWRYLCFFFTFWILWFTS